jgi:hypothetical protein
MEGHDEFDACQEARMTDPEELPRHAAKLFLETGLTVTGHDGLVAIHHPQMSMDLGLTPANARLLAEALLEAAERSGDPAQ